MSPERPEPQKADKPSLAHTSEHTSYGQEYDGYVADQDKRLDPDVVLDVPVLKVDEIHLEVEDLQAQVSVRAELADLVKVNVGVEVHLGKVNLDIKGVEAQALLKVKLEGVLNTLDRALDSIDRNPQILGGAVRGIDRVEEGGSPAAQDPGQGTEQAAQKIGATAGQVGEGSEQTYDTGGRMADEAEQMAGNLLDETVDEEGRTVQQGIDESGNITETVLNESGDIVAEEIMGDLADLQIEEEYLDDQGQIVGRALDRSGDVVEETLDEKGNVVDLNILEKVEDRQAEDEDTGEVKATEAAERKARELGVRLSGVKGTGSGGRVLVKDVERAAKQPAAGSA